MQKDKIKHNLCYICTIRVNFSLKRNKNLFFK